MALLADYTAGTVSVSANGTVVTGVGTAWLTATFREGDIFSADGWCCRIASVDSETQLTLSADGGVRGGALSDADYFLTYKSDGSRASAQARQMIDLLGGSGNLEALGGLAGSADKIPYFTGAGTMALMDRGMAGGGLTPRGAWASGTTYNKRDLVTYNGRAFASITDDNTGNTPPNSETSNGNWMYVPVAPGPDGDDGWSPVLANVVDGERRVFRVVDWVGGAGTKPATGLFVGPSGLVVAIGDAVDVRGGIGQPNTLTIGTVEDGASAAATITGSAPDQTLNLTLPKGDKGDIGNPGPAGTITDATATGLAAGADPTVTLGGTPEARTFAFGIPKGDKGDQGIPGNDGDDGAPGADGDDGWTPVFAVVDDGARRVQQVSDWIGGTGAKPATGQYVGPAGFVSAIGDAVDIRGASGAGTGDMLAATYDPQNIATDAFDRANHTGEMPLAALEQGTGGTGIVVGRYSSSGPIGTLLLAAAASNNSVPYRTGGGVLQVGTPTAGSHATTKQYVDTGLAGKFDNPTGTTSQYVRGDGSLATFPAIPAGTVTSVGLSAPTGFSVSGSPVTGAGTLTLSYASGYTGFTTTLQTKLNGIAAGATANQSDSYLLDRANHTGTMPLSGIASPNSGPFVLGKVSTGGIAELPFSDAPTASTIARRSAGGVLRVATPTSDDHAATKLYVDTGLATKETLGEQAGINTQTGTAYTLALSDKGMVVEMNNGAANTLTIPANANVAFPVNTRIDLVQFGAGQTTIAGDSGVVIYSADGNTKLNKQYSGATLYKRSVNGWVLVGDLVA